MSHDNEPPYLGRDSLTPYPLGEVVLRWIWGFVQATAFRWSPRPFFFWRNLLLRWFGAQLSDLRTIRVFPSARITHPWKLCLGSRVLIGPHVTVYNLGRLELRRGTNVAQNVHFCGGTHDYRRWDMPLLAAPVIVGENVWIAADVFIGPGVTIGDLSIVGARSVVIQSLPPSMICVGHPCKPIKPRPFPV